MRLSSTFLTRYFTLAALCLLCSGMPVHLMGQDAIRSRMGLTVYQGDGEKITLQGQLRARIDRRYVGLPGLTVQFVNTVEGEEVLLGQTQTDADGFATIEVVPADLKADEEGFFPVEAIFKGNDQYRASDDDVDFKPVEMVLDGYVEDSLRYVKVKLSSRGEPVAEEDIELFVKSLTKPLRIAEEETDTLGEVVFAFPMDLPGNPDGTIDIRAYVEDSDDYGYIENWLTTDWGVERILASGKERALWSPAPPLWLFLAFIGILVFIWGHYLMVIYELFKLRKTARAES